ncbi:hypothetical protein JTB14_020149 [Gonioctena quinquepunctata]|nr:hypothetical protein JTB14_020149 [Gonioctena quinquepunctata]
MEMSDLNSAINTFHQVFLYYFEVNFPAKKVGVDKNKKSWVNREIRESSLALKDFFDLKQYHPEFSEQYKVAKRKHFASIQNTKEDYYQNRIPRAKNPNKEVWGVVRELTGQPSKINNIVLLCNDNKCTNPQNIANNFNIYFKNAPVDVVSKIKKDGLQPLPPLNQNINSIF